VLDLKLGPQTHFCKSQGTIDLEHGKECRWKLGAVSESVGWGEGWFPIISVVVQQLENILFLLNQVTKCSTCYRQSESTVVTVMNIDN